MTIDSIKLSISTPTEPILPGRGFYQLDEEVLFVQVGLFSKHKKFFSYLESENIHFDFDRTGHLIFMEINVPKRSWQIVHKLDVPEVVEPADIRWLDFRGYINEPEIITNRDKTLLLLKFKENNFPLHFSLASSIVAQTNKNKELSAIIITDIYDDMAGKEISSFRKNSRLQKSYLV